MKVSGKFYDFCRRHPYLILLILLGATSLVVYYQYVLGNSTFLFNDAGADTQEQYLMQFTGLVNQIRSGNLSLWDFSNGFGVSIFWLNLFDPSLILLILLGVVFGPSVIPGLLIYIHIGKLLLAGVCCYLYLGNFSFSGKARLTAAYLYAFNGFITVWGQHYQFSMAMVYLPLFLFFLERSFRRNRFSPSVAVMTMVMLIYSFYTGYMILLFTVMYVVIRLFLMQKDSWKARLIRFVRTGFTMVLGLLMSMFSLLPSIFLVLNVSSRLTSSNVSALQRLAENMCAYPASYYISLFKRFFSSNLEGIANNNIQSTFTGYLNYYEAPNVFFSVLLVILLVQFAFLLFSRKQSRREKISDFVILILCGFFLLIQSGSIIFNAFSGTTSRHTFLLFPLFAVFTARMLDKILKEHFFSKVGAGICIPVIVYIYYTGYQQVAHPGAAKLVPLVLMITGLLILLLLLLSTSEKWRSTRRQRLVWLGILCLLVVNVAADTHITVRNRSSIRKNDTETMEYLYDSDMQEITAYVEETDPDFARLEKTFADVAPCMEASVHEYNGVSSYNSTMNGNLQQFYQALLPNFQFLNFARITYRHIMHDDVYATLMGVKYVVSRDPDYSSDSYRFVKQFGSLYLFENEHNASLGHFFTQTTDDDTWYLNASEIDRTAMLQDTVLIDEGEADSLTADELKEKYPVTVLEDFIDYDQVSSAIEEPERNEEEGYITFCQELDLGTTKALQKQDAPVTMSFHTSVTIPVDMMIYTYNDTQETPTTQYEQVCGVQDTDYVVSLTIPEDTTRISFRMIMHDIFVNRDPNTKCMISGITFRAQSSVEAIDEAKGTVTVEATDNDSHLTGTIEAEEDGLVMLAIPYEEGWTITVDDQKVDTFRADYGFIGFKVSGGEHTLHADYSQPYLKEGALISLLAIGIFVYLCIRSRRKMLQVEEA